MPYDPQITQDELLKRASGHIMNLTRTINEGQWAYVQNWQNFLTSNGWTLPADLTAVTAAIAGATEEFVTDYNAAMSELQGLKTAYDNNAQSLWKFI
jgi:hypothetical protein